MFTSDEREFCEAVSAVVFMNPFEREAVVANSARALELARNEELGRLHTPQQQPAIANRPELEPVLLRAVSLLEILKDRVRSEQPSLSREDYQLYQDFAHFVLYFTFRDRFQQTLLAGLSDDAPTKDSQVEYWPEYLDMQMRYLGFKKKYPSPLDDPAHLFACYFQVRRAYHQIRTHIIGDSDEIARLRARVWESIFTHDFRRYGLMLYDRMHEIPTLITGPSGTGKELVANAIGLSRFIGFDSRQRCFLKDAQGTPQNFQGSFHTVNIAALAPTLVESELFGHMKGAFTGADKNHIGWFETCEQAHSIFLDEIGELDASIQVKLLRVLQNRTFQRLGETNRRKFQGKLITATNRNLQTEMEAGRFREDLYYRLCADMIDTPTLQAQLGGNPRAIDQLVRHIALRILEDPEEADRLTKDVVKWIDRSLGWNYSWPGNFRELEQCVRNVLVRNSYHPPVVRRAGFLTELQKRFEETSLTMDELTTLYATWTYRQTSNHAETARRLGIDQRTAKKKVDATLLEAIKRTD